MVKEELMARLSAGVGASEEGAKILKDVEKDGYLVSKEDFETQLKSLQELSKKYAEYGDEDMLAFTKKKIEIFERAINILEGED